MRWAALSVGFMLAASAAAQWVPEPHFRQWGRSEGLLSNSITALAKDSSGFLWVGTSNGLYRFDGRLFEEHRSVGPKGAALPNDHVTALLAVGEGVIVGTKGGACFVDKRSGTHGIDLDDRSSAKATPIRSITDMGDGSVVICTESDMNLSVRVGAPLRAVPFALPDRVASASVLLPLKDGRLLFCVNGSGLVVPGSGDFGVSMHGSSFPYPGHTLTALHEIGAGRVLGTGWDNAIHLFDLQRMRQEARVLPTATALSFSDDEIRCSVRLPDGRFAIGTQRSGLFFFDPLHSRWSSKEALLPGAHVQAMLVDKDRLWLGTTGGLFLLDMSRVDQRVMRLHAGRERERVHDLFTWADGRVGLLSNERIWRDVMHEGGSGLGPFSDAHGPLELNSATADEKGRLFIGTQRSIHRLDPDATALRHVHRSWGPFQADNIPSTLVNCISLRQGPNGTEVYWSAYGHGSFSMDPDTMEPAFTVSVQPDVGDHLVRRITIGDDGRIWLAGAVRGITEVTRLLSCRTIIERYRAFANGSSTTFPRSGLCAVRHWSLAADGSTSTALDGWDIIGARNGGYWCSAGGILYRFHPEDRIPFQEVARAAGLQGITLDGMGRVWGIASGGLMCFDPRTARTTHLTTSLLLGDLSGYPITDGEGRIWATNGEAILYIHPDELLREEAAPLPRFAALSLFDQRTDSLLQVDAPELAYDQNFLFITPSVLDPTHGNDAHFRYRIAGRDARWIDLGDGERIALTSLAPGRYALELAAARRSSEEHWATTIWSFTILPPWWRSWWAITILVAGVFGAIALALRYRRRQQAREQSLRDRLARDLHDDIGSTLGSISYFSELGRQQLDEADLESARGVMDRMGVRSREMIGRMSDIVWSVDPKNDGGAPLSERMRLFAAETFAAKDIALEFHADEGIATLKLDMVQRRELFLVLKEAVTNAGKHAGCTRVRVALERKNGNILLTIEDDGKGLGRAPQDRMNGNGLASMHKRAAAIGGHLEITDATRGGTRVRLSAPLRRTAS